MAKLEKVGTLRKGRKSITILRKPVLAYEGYRFYHYFVKEGGKPQLFKAFEWKEERECPTPSILEEWIEQRLEEGYKLTLEIEKLDYTDLDAQFAGQRLSIWYSYFLSYYSDPEKSGLKLWAWYDSLQEALAALDIPRNDFCEYWALLYWERDILVGFFKECLSDIWEYSWDVVRSIARELDRYKEWEWGQFPLGDAVSYIKRESEKHKTDPEDVVRRLLEKEVEGKGKAWDYWLIVEVWNNLVNAAAEEEKLPLR